MSWLTRPVVLRGLGLFGSVCCAADAYLFGAATAIRRNVTVASILHEPYGPVILLLWVVGLAALCVAWWFGRRLSLSPRWVLATAALWALPLIVAPPLASRDMYANACQGALYDAGLNPYLVGVSAQPCPWLDSVSVVWRDTPTPYGPVFIMLAGLAAAAGSQLVALIGFRLLAVLGVAGIAAVLPALARRRGVLPGRALWLVVCCPLVPVHLIGGGHNDAITIAFLVAGLAVLSRPASSAAVDDSLHAVDDSLHAGDDSVHAGELPDLRDSERRVYPMPRARLIVGGALLGLAIAVKLTVGVVLPFAALLAAGGLAVAGWREVLRCAAWVMGSALGLLVLLSYASGLGMGWATALSGAGESVNWSSPPTAVGLAAEAVGRWFGADLSVVPAVRLVALILLPITLAVILWRFRDRDPLVGAGLALLTVIFYAPITQPWYLTWPLAVLAVSTARARWLAGTIVVSMATILPDGTGAFRPVGDTMAVLMLLLVGWVAVRSVRWLRGAEIVSRADQTLVI